MIRVREKISDKFTTYPNKKLVPLIGHVGNEQYYEIVENERPLFDYRTHKIERVETYTENIGELLPIWEVTYKLQQLNNDQIIENLNSVLGEHLDSNYPEWERIKHNAEITKMLIYQAVDAERKQYIESLFDWATECRAQRDEMESELINNGVLPDFKFSDRP